MVEATVVVPTHNRSRLLATTLRSLLAQQDVDLEVVVVDDASTDDTAATVEAFADRRVRLLHHDTPRRVSGARNAGMAQARGEWVSFCDDDDLWAPGKLAAQLAAARRTGRDWAYAGVVNVNLSLRPVSVPALPTPEQVVRRLPRYNAVPGGGSNVVVRRDLLERVGTFDEGLRNTEDWELWLRLSRHGPPACAPAPLVAYRLHASNASLDIGEILAGIRRIERRHGTRVDRGVVHRWLAESCLRQGRRGPALRHMGLAVSSGQAAGVAADVAAVVRRRLRLPGRVPDPVAREWMAAARQWLAPFAESAPAGP